MKALWRKIITFLLCAVFMVDSGEKIFAESIIVQSMDQLVEGDETEEDELDNIPEMNLPVQVLKDSVVNDALKACVSYTEQLPDLNDGIIAQIDTDTEIFDELKVHNDTYRNKNSIVSNSNIEVAVSELNMSNIFLATDSITFNAEKISSNQFSIIYSKTGNIEISAENVNLNGIFYAPNGQIIIHGKKVALMGMLISNGACVYAEDMKVLNNMEAEDTFEELNNMNFDLVKESVELYGKYYTEADFDYQNLAKAAVISKSVNGEEDYEKINLSKRLEVYDAQNQVNNYIFNYSIEDKQKGYLILGAHSRTLLVDKIVQNEEIDSEEGKVYYLLGEIYIENEGEWYTSDGHKVTKEKMKDIFNQAKACLLNIRTELLREVESENQGIIERLNQGNLASDFLKSLSAQYPGTDGSAYGYGGIVKPVEYLKGRYGKTPTLVDSGRSLKINSRTMKEISGKKANNCSLVAITKVIKYWAKHRGKTNANVSVKSLYKRVEKFGKKYGYTDKGGTSFTKINNITIDATKSYGYQCNCNGIYVWNFRDNVKKEIDANRPVIMNIARGYYGDHSVTVVGYNIYKVGNIKYPMIKISDGWHLGYRYIDYNAFAYDLIHSGFGSFDTVEIN